MDLQNSRIYEIMQLKEIYYTEWGWVEHLSHNAYGSRLEMGRSQQVMEHKIAPKIGLNNVHIIIIAHTFFNLGPR